MTISVKLQRKSGKFNDESYLEHIDYRLSEKLSELVVRKTGSIHISQRCLKKNIDELLPAYDEDENICDVALYKGGDYQTLVKQINFPTVRAMNTVYPF